jgi:electron transport complex protein RnfA
MIEFAGAPDGHGSRIPPISRFFRRITRCSPAGEAGGCGPDKKTVFLKFGEDLDLKLAHTSVWQHSIRGERHGRSFLDVKKSYFGYLFSILIGAMLINNYVFTKSIWALRLYRNIQEKEYGGGMGVTFTIVIVISAMISWFLYQFVLKPYRLDFLQVVTFIASSR